MCHEISDLQLLLQDTAMHMGRALQYTNGRRTLIQEPWSVFPLPPGPGAEKVLQCSLEVHRMRVKGSCRVCTSIANNLVDVPDICYFSWGKLFYLQLELSCLQ